MKGQIFVRLAILLYKFTVFVFIHHKNPSFNGKKYLISTGEENNKAACSYALTKASIDTIASFMKSITYITKIDDINTMLHMSKNFMNQGTIFYNVNKLNATCFK